MEIKVLMRRGAGIREMARELRCSRNTIWRYLREKAAGQYGPRPARPTKLDPYRDYVLARIDAARPYWISAVVLLREIKERGYLAISIVPFSSYTHPHYIPALPE